MKKILFLLILIMPSTVLASVYTPRSLYEESSRNPVRFEEIYNNKPITVKGNILDISVAGYGGSKDVVMVLTDTDPFVGKSYKILVMMKWHNRHSVMKYEVGGSITVRGVLSIYSGYITINDAIVR